MFFKQGLLVSLLCFCASNANADVVTSIAGAKANWTRGLLMAKAAAAADLLAPRVEVARVKATRQARARAIAIVKKAAKKMGHRGTITTDHTIVADRLWTSDGSTVLSVAVPITLLRSGPEVSFSNTVESSALVIDARGSKAKPSLAFRLQAGEVIAAGPIIFHNNEKEWLADLRVGESPLRVKKTASQTSVLKIEEKSEVLEALRSGVPCFVLLGEKK